MNLYELNKAGYGSLPTLTEPELYPYQNKILDFLKKQNNKYYMLLNHDVHYFTLFDCNDSSCSDDKIIQELMSIVHDLGAIKAIENNMDNQGIEFWITDYTGECHLYLFFGYDRGVIKV